MQVELHVELVDVGGDGHQQEAEQQGQHKDIAEPQHNMRAMFDIVVQYSKREPTGTFSSSKQVTTLKIFKSDGWLSIIKFCK